MVKETTWATPIRRTLVDPDDYPDSDEVSDPDEHPYDRCKPLSRVEDFLQNEKGDSFVLLLGTGTGKKNSNRPLRFLSAARI